MHSKQHAILVYALCHKLHQQYCLQSHGSTRYVQSQHHITRQSHSCISSTDWTLQHRPDLRAYSYDRFHGNSMDTQILLLCGNCMASNCFMASNFHENNSHGKKVSWVNHWLWYPWQFKISWVESMKVTWNFMATPWIKFHWCVCGSDGR